MNFSNQSNLTIEESVKGVIHHTTESITLDTLNWNPAMYVAKNEEHNNREVD